MALADFWGSTLSEVLERSVHMSPATRERVGEWSRLPRAGLAVDFSEATFIVVDTETSGLDVRRDTLLSIGACVVRDEAILVGNSFYRELRQDDSSDEANILIHGIGREAQLAGEHEADALSAFLQFAGRYPLVAFNAPFDHEFLAVALRRYLGVRFRPHWVDLAELPKAMFPTPSLELKTLDDWLAHFGIFHAERHNALADAYCTAQLLLIMLRKARAEGYTTARGLERAERYHHWQRR